MDLQNIIKRFINVSSSNHFVGQKSVIYCFQSEDLIKMFINDGPLKILDSVLCVLCYDTDKYTKSIK